MGILNKKDNNESKVKKTKTKKVKKAPKTKNNNIKTIAVENIDKDLSNIKVIGEVESHHSGTIKNVLSVLVVILITLFLCFCVYICINTVLNKKLVQVDGQIAGAETSIAGISIVDSNYSVRNYIKVGSVVYYDCDDEDSLFTTNANYEVGKVEKIADNNIYLESDDYMRDKIINLSQIDYVVNP